MRRATLFRWRSRFEEAGLVGLADPVHVGRASELDPILEQVILTVRLLTNWNSRRIAAEFGRRGATVGHGQPLTVVVRCSPSGWGLSRGGGARLLSAGCPA